MRRPGLRSLLPCLSACLLLAAAPAGARGVSPYLPLNLAPEIERQIERVLILADKPVMTRPIAAATVLDALPAACKRDEALCKRVRRYLNRYMEKWSLANGSAEVAAGDGAVVAIPNRRGLLSDSAWEVAADGYLRIGDYVLVSVGGVANEEATEPTGSMVSVGFEYAQLDVGYRDHWFSSFRDSAMLISTEASTLPSVTLSNYTPISFAGLRYEVFLAEMEHSENIVFGEGYTAGRPRLAGLSFSVEPVPGWSLSASRLVQFGGGERGGSSLRDLFDALSNPSRRDNTNEGGNRDLEFGNQLASLGSRFIFPGRVPFAAYLEYAGEDTSFSTNYRLGNASLSIGITLPQVWRNFDLTYEMSEWQNGWYVNSLYADGLTEGSRVLGHWGADRRVPGDAVGAQSHMLSIGWAPGFGGLMQVRARTIDNEDYSSVEYARGYDVTLSYSRAMRGHTAGVEVMAGRDTFGENFSRLAGFVRFGDEWSESHAAGGLSVSEGAPGAELFVDAGLNASRVQIRLDDGGREIKKSTQLAPHVAIGARRAVSQRNDLGVRLELDRIDSELMLAVRALDYRYRFSSPLALSAFIGAARYDAATPAYGYYFGGGVQWRDILPHMDVNLDVRYFDKVARDKLLSSDPPTDPRPDIFYDVAGAILALSYRF